MPISLRHLLILLVLVLGGAVQAQDVFRPVIQVNDRVVTEYEIDQRIRFLALLGQPGDLNAEARRRLINERLQAQASQDAGIELTDERVNQGIDEFAGRVNLNRQQLVQALNEGGVAIETLRDFVAVGVAWRELVQSRFGPGIQVSEAEIDRSIIATGSQSGVRVLLSEIVLPARTPEELQAAEARANEISRITSFGGFAEAARRFSASSSRARGGRLDWAALATLPGEVRGQVITLVPGELTSPIRAQNALVIFQLRAIEEVAAQTPDALAIDYAVYSLAEGQGSARVLDRLDTCDDLYGIARGQPEERLLREVQPLADIPSDLALELARLDDNEVGGPIAFRGGQALVMLCGRVLDTDGETEIDRGQVALQIRNRRLTSLAEEFLAELRANAEIVTLN